MILARFTRATLHLLDWLGERLLPPKDSPKHQAMGRRGEEEAYFYLRRLGYVIVARNFRSPRRRGEIDLIAWEKDVLVFVEVKTRSTQQVKPAEAAVDRGKRREISAVAREYLRHFPSLPQWRMDVLSVYYQDIASQPRCELFRNVLPMS